MYLSPPRSSKIWALTWLILFRFSRMLTWYFSYRSVLKFGQTTSMPLGTFLLISNKVSVSSR